jgi:ubiquinone/menaquinone biosynthesis C-methylase UbiE
MSPRLRLVLGGAAVAFVASSLWARRHPSACPYSQRWMIEVPHPGISRRALLETLEPQPGERLFELGPGTGYYTLDVAERLGDGTLDVFDLQQEMLDHVMRAAERRGIRNIVPQQGDARELPYPDDHFDGAFLVTVLGEIPDQDAALRELARVMKPGGRVVFGEMVADPHVVTTGALRRRAVTAGLEFERRRGNPLAFFARFRKP